MRNCNQIPAGDLETRTRLLKQMLGHLGRNTRVNQPVYVDLRL